MRVLRVEHRRIKQRYDNQVYAGPYTTPIKWDGLDEMIDEHINAWTHPSIDDDIRKYLALGPEWFCGFSNNQALYDWFGDWLGPLHDAGFVIRVYETQSVFYGESRKQLVFKTAESKKIVTYNLI